MLDWTRPALTAALAFIFAAGVAAQDPTKVAPDAYKQRFENEWVKVTAVHYAAKTKIPVHDHSRWPAAYVYLNDAGPIIFSHTDWEHPVLTRPALKRGSFRLSPTTAVAETHQVENPGDRPSDFLRIEFKTDAVGRASLRGRFPALKLPAKKNFSRIQFENEQMRVTRLAIPPGKQLSVAAARNQPALLVVLSSTRISTAGDAYHPGDVIWINAGNSEKLINLEATPFEVLRFDFKTAAVTR